jgi:uncharacterized Zn-binding protein involved in type VI secretion
MPKAARVGDKHKAVASPAEYIALVEGIDDETATEEILTGSHNVFINGQPVALVGDECESGATYISTGCKNVFVNGRPVARVTDLTCHKTVIVTGSPNVFIGAPTAPLQSLGVTEDDLKAVTDTE